MVSERALRNKTFVDALMLALAVVSVGLLTYVTFADVPPRAARLVYVADTSICGVFALEFLWRWRAVGWQKWFPLRSWYEIIGMIPLAYPALRSFRLLRIVVIIARLVRTTDRTVGERIIQRFVQRFAHQIVSAIKRPITVAILDEVVKVLETGNYPQNLARSLGENQQLLSEIVVEKVRTDPQAGRFSRLPFHDEVVRSAVDTTVRITLEILADRRIDEFFSDIVRENRLQIRSAVEQGLHEESGDEEALAQTLSRQTG